MDEWIYLLIIIIVVVVLVLALNRKQDGFQGPQNCNMQVECKIDENCPGDQFCYMGRCWRYWQGHPMPWSTCRNPYCGSTDPYASCAASPGKCSPYCKCKMNRRPGGSLDKDCFPSCGQVCLRNEECPKGCPACVHGICSAPQQDEPIL
jgi:hypothetical protein